MSTRDTRDESSASVVTPISSADIESEASRSSGRLVTPVDPEPKPRTAEETRMAEEAAKREGAKAVAKADANAMSLFSRMTEHLLKYPRWLVLTLTVAAAFVASIVGGVIVRPNVSELSHRVANAVKAALDASAPKKEPIVPASKPEAVEDDESPVEKKSPAAETLPDESSKHQRAAGVTPLAEEE